MNLSDLKPDQIKAAEPKIIGMLLDKAKHLTKTIKALGERAKVLLHDGIKIPNWHLKDGSKQREIVDVPEAVRQLLAEQELKIKPSDLLAVCKLPIPAICELIVKKTGCTKMDADLTVAAVLGDNLKSKQKAASLEQDK